MYNEEYENRGFPFRDFLLKLILIIIFVFLLCWLLPKFIAPTIVNENNTTVDVSALTSQIFADNLERMKEAAITYYTDERLPKNVGDKEKMTLSDMIGKKIITPLVDKNNKPCDVEGSYVEITKMDDEYLLKVNLKDSEKEGGLTSTVIAKDGIAVIVNKDNPVADLTLENIAKIYTGEITNWKDIGGNDAEIVLIGREANSGTRDGFESVVGVEDKCKYRQELTATGDVISAVSGNPNAIGYASVASVKDTVKALKVEEITPNESTIKDGTYKIQRPFVLVTKQGAKLSDAAQKFYDFCLSDEAKDIITKAGVVPAN